MTDPAPSTTTEPPGTHEVGVDRRFSDLDALGHVNSVRYLDYLDEGLAGWLGWYDVPHASVTVTAHRLGFAAPMHYSRSVARVVTSVVGVEGDLVHVAQRVLSGEDDTVHLRAESWLRVDDRDSLAELRGYADARCAHEWRPVPTSDGPSRHTAAVTVRSRDLGPDGLVRGDAVVEYFQEARVQYFADLHTRGEEWAMVVLARTDVELRGEVRPDDAAVEVRSRIAHLGRSSFTISADLVARDEVQATSTVVAVCVGAEDQRPVPVPAAQRARLERELAGG